MSSTTLGDRLQAIADELAQARVDSTPVAGNRLALTLAEAYQVQDEQRARMGHQVGWKLGMSSRAKQEQEGISEPIRGFLAAEHVLGAGAPLAVANYIQPRVEPEIVFLMGRDLDNPEASVDDVLTATEGVSVGLRCWTRDTGTTSSRSLKSSPTTGRQPAI
jgi:2-keto-4-pentenoate hydratase